MQKLLLAGLAVVAFAGVAQAETNVCVRPYVSAKASYSKLDLDTRVAGEKAAKKDWVWGGSLAGGVKVCAFRGELEFNQSATAKDTRSWGTAPVNTTRSNQSYRSYMLNGYFDVPTYTPVHPYVGAGIGVARIKSRLGVLDTDTATKKRETNLAYQLMAGVGYNLTRNWTLDVGYRWVDNGHSKWNTALGEVKMDSTEHQMTVGVRYTF